MISSSLVFVNLCYNNFVKKAFDFLTRCHTFGKCRRNSAAVRILKRRNEIAGTQIVHNKSGDHAVSRADGIDHFGVN